MDNSVEFNDISIIAKFVKQQPQISLSDAHKIIRQFIERKIDYKYSGCLCLSNTYISSNHVNDHLNPFFNKIDFENVYSVDQKPFFLDMLDFMHDLMFNLAFISDTNKKADFNLFFMYRKREIKISGDVYPFGFYDQIGYGKVISDHPSGCFYKILKAIPPEYLQNSKFKQKLKRIADDSLKVLDRADRVQHSRTVPYLSLKIYLYANYDLGSDADKQNLLDELHSEINAIKYGERVSSYWPEKIFFEKQTLYDIEKLIRKTNKNKDVDIAKRSFLLADVLICFQTKDLKEDDFGKLCKIMDNCVSNRFVFEKDGSDKEFFPYYVFLPWLTKNLFDCKEIIGKHRAKFLFDKLQILAGSNFAFDENTAGYILQQLQKLFEQKELSIAEPIKFYKFTLRLLYNSFTLSDTLYQQYKVMIQNYLKVDDQFFRQKDEWILPMIKNDLQIYYSRFLADRAKLFRRKIERCVTKKGISEPTRVCEFKTVGQNKLYCWIHNLEHDDNAKHLYSNWITSNVIKTKKKGKYWINNGDGTVSNLPEEAEYPDIKDFFGKIDFAKDKFEDEEHFFDEVLTFMHNLMFLLFSVNDSDVGIYFQKRNVNFNSFFMYCQREDPKSYDKNDKQSGTYGKLLNEKEPSGYLAKILAAIPEKLLDDKEIKQTIKKIADDSLKALDELDAEKCGLIFPYLFLKIYLYKKYDLATSDHDKQILFNEFKKEINSIKNGLRKFN